MLPLPFLARRRCRLVTQGLRDLLNHNPHTRQQVPSRSPLPMSRAERLENVVILILSKCAYVHSNP